MKADVAKLRAARELIARPSGWTQEAMCRNADGLVCELFDAPVCWCSLGALHAVKSFGEEADILRAVIGNSRISKWNDTLGRTQAEVVAAFDKAITLAETK